MASLAFSWFVTFVTIANKACHLVLASAIMASSGDVLTFVGVDALTVFVVKSFGANAVVRTVGVDAIGKLGALDKGSKKFRNLANKM